MKIKYRLYITEENIIASTKLFYSINHIIWLHAQERIV